MHFIVRARVAHTRDRGYESKIEDEDGEELTPAMDAAILRTLARIKRRDPAIYDAGKDVFEGESHSIWRRGVGGAERVGGA